MHEIEYRRSDPTDGITSFVFEKTTRDIRPRYCARIAGCAIEADDGGLDNADVDVIVGRANATNKRRMGKEFRRPS